MAVKRQRWEIVTQLVSLTGENKPDAAAVLDALLKASNNRQWDVVKVLMALTGENNLTLESISNALLEPDTITRWKEVTEKLQNYLTLIKLCIANPQFYPIDQPCNKSGFFSKAVISDKYPVSAIKLTLRCLFNHYQGKYKRALKQLTFSEFKDNANKDSANKDNASYAFEKIKKFTSVGGGLGNGRLNAALKKLNDFIANNKPIQLDEVLIAVRPDNSHQNNP